MTEDKILSNGHHYQERVIEVFGLPPGSGGLQRKRYEEAMEKYLADPVEPIRCRYAGFLKKLHKPKNWSAEEYHLAKVLCSDITDALEFALERREKLLAIAEKRGIKLKKGIVI